MTSIYAKVGGYVLAILLVFGALYGAYHHGETLANAEWQAKWDAEVATQALAKAQAEESARTEELRRINSNQQAQAHAIQSTAVAQTDAAAVTVSSGSVQLAAAKLAADPSSCTGHPAAAAGSPTTNHAAMVLSDLLTRADKRAADLASFADRSRIAGLACEASYDGLTKLSSDPSH
jgi:fatty acid/phospholipid biosynthesis enzyme